MKNENTQIKKVYNGSEIITNAGFTMQSKYMLPLLSRMVDEKLINVSAQTVVQAIFSYKHTEECPYPSREELARLLGKSVDYVKKALKSIKEAGILWIGKAGRKSTYDFKPFFALLERFIVEYRDKKNFAVKIADLLKVKVVKKEKKKDFSWSENYQEEKEVVPAEEATKEVAEVPALPEEIAKVCEVYNISSEGINAVEKAYTAYGSKLEVAIFIEKIVASASKKEFVNYFNTCITNAYANNEQPKAQPAPQKKATGIRQPIRKEAVPEWLEGKQETFVTMEQRIEEATGETLLQIEEEVDRILSRVPNNKSALQHKALIEARKAEVGSYVAPTSEDTRKVETV